jgi:hypothetical protein
VRYAESRFAESTHRAGVGRLRCLRPLPRLGLLVALIALLFALFVPTAGAAEHVTVTGEYGKEGPKASGIGNGCRIAYQSSSDRIYLLSDEKIYGLQRSGPGSVAPLGGAFPITFPYSSFCGDRDLDVDQTSGNIFAVPSSTQIHGFAPTGGTLGPPWPVNVGGETCGLGITNTGEVWGGNYSASSIAKYNSAGAPAGSKALGYRDCKLAVNRQNNDLFALDYSTGVLTKYTAASGYTTTLSFGNVGTSNGGLAVNGALNRIYVAPETGTTVKAYDTNTAAVVETIDVGGTPRDVAVDEATDTLFVQVNSGSSGYIKEYLGVKTPKATTGEPTGNTEVSGTADPNEVGPITECYFEWGLTTGYGKKTNCTESVPFNTVQTVHAVLPPAEMTGEETYHYRLVLDTGVPNVIGKGGDKPIVPHYVKQVKTDPATEIKRTTAKLNGSFEGNTEATSYFFEYGTAACPCATRMPTAPTEVSAGSPPGPGTTPMSVMVSGLTPETVYHFRVVAKNPQGTSPGGDKTFTTPKAVNAVAAEDATNQKPTSVTLNGSYDGSTSDAPPAIEGHSFYFEWGPTTSYGTTTAVPPGTPVTAQAGTVHVTADITGLSTYLPTSVPYHFRLIVTNSTGTTVGADHTFLPAPPDLPQITDVSADEVNPSAATLSAEINPGNGPTTYLFEYGPATSYGSLTPDSDSIGSDETAHPVSSSLTGLTPGTLYHYRVVAVNFGGTSYSADQTFVTPNVPVIESSSASSTGQTTAHLGASVIANASPTSVTFEYGPSSAYGQSTAPIFTGQELLSRPVDWDLTGLSPGTTYHARAVAANGIGTTLGPDLTFTTQPTPVTEEPPKRVNCPKGKVRRHGKCVKRHRKRHRGHARGARNG